MIVKSDKTEIQDFLVDAANYKGDCDKVYFPESDEEIVEILKEANSKRIKITVSGNGTGLTGARVPEGGIVIATNRLNKIIEINSEEKYAVLQTGVILSDFHEKLDELNLYYPPDPTEQNCFIGATVSTNASGAKTFKYGPTRNFVLGMKIILPEGETLYLERGKFTAENRKLKIRTDSDKELEIDLPKYRLPFTKNSAGYFIEDGMDALDLFIGQEGTLGIITEVKIKLLPKPESVFSSVVFFDDEIDALKFIIEARENSRAAESRIDALGLEFFDRNALMFLRDDYMLIPENAFAAVWLEQETTPESEESIFDAWVEVINKNNGNEETAWFALNDKERRKFQDFRHAVSYKVNEYITRKNKKKVGTDVAVPDQNFNELYFYSKKIVEEKKLNYIAYGHFGDNHLHLNMLPADEKEYSAAKKIYGSICSKAVELNGTISAEHGIGKLKKEYLKLMFSQQEIEQMANLKKTLDPNWILGAGNIFDSQKYN